VTSLPETKTSESSPPPVPRHVAIIMDGNGRWAQQRGLPRAEGHRRGVEAVRSCVRAAGELGISYLTLYTFSSENWRRPFQEITDLMGLLKFFIKRDLAELHRENVQIRAIGTLDRVDREVAKLILDAIELTRNNTGLVLTTAFNYGARDEIVRAAQAIAAKAKAGELSPETISAELLEAHLDTADMPDPDLMIRTGGDKRISNFLLWQCAYSEFVFLDAFWPDFSKEMLAKAVSEFQGRERRFGGLSERYSA
jgi:undecaprenyl diphosphate synthase